MKIGLVGLVLVMAVLAGGLGGCADTKFVQITNEAEFQQQVLESAKPVVVDFYKGACPTCGLVQPTLDKLMEEYRGRVVFAQFKLMEPYFAVTSEQIKDQYDIALFPTVILFNHGREQQRWALEYNFDKYRHGIDEAVAGRQTPVTAEK